MIKVKRALVSVSDKSGLLDFVRGLSRLGVELISTGGTAKALKSAGIAVREVSEVTGFPEILDGRVKTLHPAVHGGILAVREKQAHLKQLEEHKIGLIDMVVVNLYPFEQVTRKGNVSLQEALENIDIGGPTMLRSAAKNFKNVAVVCNPAKYQQVLGELENNNGLLSDSVLRSLAVDVFERTSQYDQAIFKYLEACAKDSSFSGLPDEMTMRYQKVQDLRYGENPHQAGALYADVLKSRGLASLKQLHGKELSFNNILDLEAAIRIVKDLRQSGAVVIKHNNPTGVAEAKTLDTAFKEAWSCDKISAFGGIIGCNEKVDLKTAELIMKSGFMECVVAPGFDKAALKVFTQKKNLRIIQINLSDFGQDAYDVKQIDGGLLVQDRDFKNVEQQDLKIVTKKKPTAAQVTSMLFGWRVIKHLKSNAMMLVKGTKTVGIGCGQTSRVDSTRHAISRAGRNTQGAILASEAFIPKTDNVLLAAKAGIKAIIQTGGSIADQDVIAACDKAGIAMAMTSVRHFKH